MGKVTGFMEYERQDKQAEAPVERIRHYNEFHTPLSKEEQEIQGARCMAVSYTHLDVYKRQNLGTSSDDWEILCYQR